MRILRASDVNLEEPLAVLNTMGIKVKAVICTIGKKPLVVLREINGNVKKHIKDISVERGMKDDSSKKKGTRKNKHLSFAR